MSVTKLFVFGILSLVLNILADLGRNTLDSETHFTLMRFLYELAGSNTICSELWIKMLKSLMCSSKNTVTVKLQNVSSHDYLKLRGEHHGKL